MQKEEVEEQSERLSRKHIQTLAFLQGVVKENNALKAKIAEYDEQKLHCEQLHTALDEAQAKLKHLQEQGSKRTDDISAVLVQKHQEELKKLAEEKATLERYWERLSKEMRMEISRLEKENSKLNDSVALMEKAFRSERESLTEKIRQSSEEAESMNAEMEQLSSINRNRMEEMSKVTRERDHLLKSSTIGLAEAAQKVKELQLRNEELLRNVNHSTQCHEEAVKESEAYKMQLRKANKERTVLSDRVASLDAELSSANSTSKQLQRDLDASELRGRQLQEELERLREEIRQQQLLRLQTSAAALPKESKSPSFRDFVEMKRELVAMREENSQLKEHLQIKPKLLPSIRLSRPNSSDSRAA